MSARSSRGEAGGQVIVRVRVRRRTYSTSLLTPEQPPKTEKEFLAYLSRRLPGYSEATINRIVEYAKNVFGG